MTKTTPAVFSVTDYSVDSDSDPVYVDTAQAHYGTPYGFEHRIKINVTLTAQAKFFEPVDNKEISLCSKADKFNVNNMLEQINSVVRIALENGLLLAVTVEDPTSQQATNSMGVQ